MSDEAFKVVNGVEVVIDKISELVVVNVNVVNVGVGIACVARVTGD